MDNYLDSFREMLSLRGLTDHTIVSYSTYISAYLQYLSDIACISPDDASWQHMRDFIFWLQNTRALSDRTINACISQLRFFHIYVLHKSWDPYQLPFRKFDSFVPFIPSRQEMQTFLFSITDIKYMTILCLMFSAGLRVSEVRHLKCSDIEPPESASISEPLKIALTAMRSFLIKYGLLSYNTGIPFPPGQRPNDWLFPQKRYPDKPIDHYAVPYFIRSHEKELGWEHRFTCHTFRHAFATYHYEDGTDLLTLKALMGHRSIASTAVYIHMSSNTLMACPSPFDKMGGDEHADI